MKSPYLQFLKNLLIYSLIIVLIYIGLSYIIPGGWLSMAVPYLFPFYIATTLITYYLTLKALHHRFSGFVNRFMLITAIKLVWYAIILVAYLLIFSYDAIAFALNFFILYLAYTIFETVSLIKYSRKVAQQIKNKQV